MICNMLIHRPNGSNNNSKTCHYIRFEGKSIMYFHALLLLVYTLVFFCEIGPHWLMRKELVIQHLNGNTENDRAAARVQARHIDMVMAQAQTALGRQ